MPRRHRPTCAAAPVPLTSTTLGRGLKGIDLTRPRHSASECDRLLDFATRSATSGVGIECRPLSERFLSSAFQFLCFKGMSVPQSSTVDRVKLVLRDSLKLGADASIADDMPLIGGEYDLDSLDILLIVTSIEKEFGIKIPNESVGRSAFASVTTLAAFVDAMRGNA